MRRTLVLLSVPLVLAAALTGAARWSKNRIAGSAGLVEKVYAGPEFSGEPVHSRVADAVDLSVLDLNPTLSRRFFSATWSGIWQVPTSGTVDIYAGGDDSVRVSIDGRLIIERNEALGFHTMSAPAVVEAGPHQLLVEYVQLGGGLGLRVMWAPAGEAVRPFATESLFVAAPDARLLRRASVAATLRTLSRMAWMAFQTVAFGVLLFFTGRVTWRWFASGVPQSTARRWLDTLTRWRLRIRRPVFWLVTAVAVVWLAMTRAQGLNPQTLWADDVWFASLTKLESLWDAVIQRAPIGPGFVAMLWTARRTIGDPEISLQLLPFVLGLVGPVIVGVVVARITASYAVGLGGMALAFGAGSLAHYSIFVKPYSADFALTALLLFLAVLVLRDGRPIHGLLAGIGLLAATVSVPAVLVGLPLIHLAALAPSRQSAEAGPWRRRWLIAALYDIGLLVLYVALLRSRTNPEVRTFWTGSFMPISSTKDAIEFLSTTGWTALREALPVPLVAWTPLAGAGLLSLLIRREWRWFGLFVGLVYSGAIAASALELYPIGIGIDAKARVTIYSYALTLMLVAVGFDALSRWLPFRTLVRIAGALFVATTVAHLEPAVYFRLDHVQMVWSLQSRITDADALVFNNSAAYLTGFYATWPIRADPDESPQSFIVRLNRPKTLTLKRSAEEGAGGLEELDAFLARELPPRVFFMSSRRDTKAAEDAIQAHGFVEVARKSSNVSTRLIEYQRAEGSDQKTP